MLIFLWSTLLSGCCFLLHVPPLELDDVLVDYMAHWLRHTERLEAEVNDFTPQLAPKSCTHHLHHYQCIQHFHVLLAMKPVVIWVVSCTNRSDTKFINLCINIFRKLYSMVWHFITISEWSLPQIDQWLGIFWWLLRWDDGLNIKCWELLANCQLMPSWT